jgi:hypothetical protein
MLEAPKSTEVTNTSTAGTTPGPPKERWYKKLWNKCWADRKNSKAHFYWLGAPLPGRTAQLELYKAAIFSRFPFDRDKPPQTSKDGVDYVYRAYDRLINKSRGLLTFCGLLFTSFGLIAQRLKDADKTSNLALAGALLPLLASLPLLVLFWMNWGASDDYASKDADFKSIITATQRRTWLVGISVWLTLIDVVVLSALTFKWLRPS